MKINYIFRIILFYFLLKINLFAGEQPCSFISASGKNYTEARTAVSKIAMSQGMKIIGQNYYRDNNGNWTVTIKVRTNPIIIFK